MAAAGWSASAGFLDYDNDGKLDLFVTRYIDWSFQDNHYCGERSPGYRAYCHPDNYDGMANVLYHNNGDGTFTDVSSKARGSPTPRARSSAISFADYDHDGFIDVYVANDSVQSFLYRNNGNGTFAEVGLLAGVGFNEDGKTFAGMGVDFADYDNDGNPDVVVTDLSNERYRLFRQNGDGSFRDRTELSGLGSKRHRFPARHSCHSPGACLHAAMAVAARRTCKYKSGLADHHRLRPRLGRRFAGGRGADGR